jgi:hypothetical protein
VTELGASERFPRPPLRYRRLGGGYRKEDVEFALAELRLTQRQLDTDLETLRERARELEEELRSARAEVEGFRSKDAESSQTMATALRRANEIEETAQERARAIIAGAEEAVLRSRSDASRPIDETGRLKENLVGVMRGVVAEFLEAITRVEHGEPSFLRQAPAATSPPPVASVPAPPPPHVAPPPPPPPPFEVAREPEPQTYEPPLATPRFAQPPEPPPGAVPPASFAAPPPVAQEEPLFEAQVELDAGPFLDFASLSTFERALARLPRVDDVYVRRLSEDRALIELTLSEQSPLLSTMREALPYEVEVRSASRSKLVINVLAHSTATR